MFGVGLSTVMVNLYELVSAINKAFTIKFPESHSDQLKIAKGFERRSSVGFDCVAGCIDGLIVWIEQPLQRDCDLLKCGQRRFYCERKSKFGFNMQAICDYNGRFLEVWIGNPASSSDFISFIRSSMYEKLSKPDFLAKGLVIFGDNAYTNGDFMVSPYKGAKVGIKDDFNFFHSQVRITIERAFGMLVQRFGLLRRAMSQHIPAKKEMAIVLACCKLQEQQFHRDWIIHKFNGETNA